MKIPENIRECAAFLEYRDDTGFHLAGTVFFVSTPNVNEPKHYCRYAVTAKHIIKMIDDRTLDGNFYFRLNSLEGGSCRIESNTDTWCFHPSDDVVDVAIMPISLQEPPNPLDWRFWDVEGFATHKTIEEIEINVGDDVFLTGLFYGHTGQKRNVPIVRAGIIAAMPDEPVKTKLGYMEAYLVEARSINGLSGSPVFVRPESNYARNIKTDDPYTLGHLDAQVGSFWLLGLMHGHWDVDASDIDMIRPDRASAEAINAGIGVVVPAQKILEAIKQPKLEKMRTKIEAEPWKQATQIMD